MSSFEIFRFVEIIFLLGIGINLLSYFIRSIIIIRHKQMKILFSTLKEGISKNIFIRNSLNLSLLLSSITVFWYMLSISKELKPLSILAAYKVNPYITIYILIACLILIIYSIIISTRNIKQVKELTPVLGYLSFWNSADNFFNTLGAGILFKPFTEMSAIFRKHLIQSEMASLLFSTLILVIVEYIYKILIVVALLYLINGKIF